MTHVLFTIGLIGMVLDLNTWRYVGKQPSMWANGFAFAGYIMVYVSFLFLFIGFLEGVIQ